MIALATAEMHRSFPPPLSTLAASPAYRHGGPSSPPSHPPYDGPVKDICGCPPRLSQPRAAAARPRHHTLGIYKYATYGRDRSCTRGALPPLTLFFTSVRTFSCARSLRSLLWSNCVSLSAPVSRLSGQRARARNARSEARRAKRAPPASRDYPGPKKSTPTSYLVRACRCGVCRRISPVG